MQTPSTQEKLIKVQNKGLITIPKRFRNKLGLKTNSLVRMRENKGSVIIEPIRTLPYPVRSYTDSELDSFFKLDEQESKKLKKESLL